MSFTLAKTERLAAILSQTPVIPVLTFSDAKSGVETSKALRDGGGTQVARPLADVAGWAATLQSAALQGATP